MIFVNGRDTTAAQIFTLPHELAHLAIGESGVTNPASELQPEAYASTIERFCNAVAAEVLLPPDEFVRGWSADRSIDENLDALARTFRVSAMVVLRRAHDLKLIPVWLVLDGGGAAL